MNHLRDTGDFSRAQFRSGAGGAWRVLRKRFGGQVTLSRAALLLLPAVVLLAAFGCQRGQTNSNQEPAGNESVSITNETAAPVPVNETETEPVAPPRDIVTERELIRLVSAFAERYGSYSNQTDFANLEALFVFMTPSFAKRTKEFVSDEREKGRDSSIYYGISTRAATVATGVVDESRGAASFTVSTFRKETIGSGGNVNSFQEQLIVDLRKDGTAWKVDRAAWQGRR